MKVIHQHEAQKHANSSTCIVYEYPLGDVDINGAIAHVHGRYPIQNVKSWDMC